MKVPGHKSYRVIPGLRLMPLDVKYAITKPQENGNIMDFYVNGDTAPGGRFNFRYTLME